MVGLRLWLRIMKKAGSLGLDDLLLFAAWLAVTMMSALCIVGALQFNLGRHIWDVPVSSYERIAEVTWLAEFSFLFCGGCTKISVLLFYRRLVDCSYDKRWKWAVIASIIFTGAWTVAFMLCLILNCNPTEAYWKAFDPTWAHDYSCVDTTFINLLAGIFAIISDFYSVILPCLITRSITLPANQKLALNIIFCMGLLCVGAGIARTYYLYEVGQKSDVSWLIYDVFIWAQLELQLGIMCASAPALRVFFRAYLHKPMSRAVHSATGSFTSKPNGDRGHKSGLSGFSIRRISEPIDAYTQRSDFGSRHYQKQIDVTVSSELSEVEEDREPRSTTPSTHSLIKSPADYEAYNLRNLETFRESLDRRGRQTPNFSQPFVWHPTPPNP